MSYTSSIPGELTWSREMDARRVFITFNTEKGDQILVKAKLKNEDTDMIQFTYTRNIKNLSLSFSLNGLPAPTSL